MRRELLVLLAGHVLGSGTWRFALELLLSPFKQCHYLKDLYSGEFTGPESTSSTLHRYLSPRKRKDHVVRASDSFCLRLQRERGECLLEEPLKCPLFIHKVTAFPPFSNFCQNRNGNHSGSSGDLHISWSFSGPSRHPPR